MNLLIEITRNCIFGTNVSHSRENYKLWCEAAMLVPQIKLISLLLLGNSIVGPILLPLAPWVRQYAFPPYNHPNDGNGLFFPPYMSLLDKIHLTTINADCS